MTQPGTNRLRRTDAGFTLVEMVVAVAIIAAAVVIAMPMAGGQLPAAGLKAAANDLVSLSRLARSAAMSSGRASELVIDEQARRYWVAGVAAPRPIPPGVSLNVEVPGASPGPRAAIAFSADGASSGGLVRLRSGRGQIVVEVDWLTGAARQR